MKVLAEIMLDGDPSGQVYGKLRDDFREWHHLYQLMEMFGFTPEQVYALPLDLVEMIPLFKQAENQAEKESRRRSEH